MLLLVTAISATAQPSKKDFLVGGSARFSISDLARDDGNSASGYFFSIQPHEGYFVKDNIAVGLISGYGRGRSTYIDQSHNSETSDYSRSINSGFFMRYYKFTGEEKRFAFIAEPRATLDLTRNGREVYLRVEDITRATSGAQEFTAAISVNSSIAYFIGKRTALELSLGGIGYRWVKESPMISTIYPARTQSLYADINLQSPSLGITVSL